MACKHIIITNANIWHEKLSYSNKSIFSELNEFLFVGLLIMAKFWKLAKNVWKFWLMCRVEMGWDWMACSKSKIEGINHLLSIPSLLGMNRIKKISFQIWRGPPADLRIFRLTANSSRTANRKIPKMGGNES